ncbi:MAG: dUTP diphosphatase [Hoeflea sp.]|nr:dUTP diphosphatase [Hoeflea sp.]
MTHPDRLPQTVGHHTPETGGLRRELRVVRLPHGEGLELPAYETPGSAGMDLRAAVDDGAPLVIAPGGRFAVPTGLVMEIPEGYEAQVRPRSGLALNSGVTCLNAPGTIDSDYRGEVKIILANLGAEPFTVTRGMRVAQLVIAPVIQVRVTLHQSLTDTARGAGGFGSTGSR